MSSTPNVVVANPTVRRYANIVIGVALIIFPALQVLEANSSLDFSGWLPAALAVTAFLAGLFGLAVTTPNVPGKQGNHGSYDPVDGVPVSVDMDEQ